jgi:hypothetical protein
MRKRWLYQVRSIEELVVGQKYYMIYSCNDFVTEFIYKGISYDYFSDFNERNDNKVLKTYQKSKSVDGIRYYPSHIIASDFNLFPYNAETNKWNNCNYISTVKQYPNTKPIYQE